MPELSLVLAIRTIEVGSFTLTGGNTFINLVAAGTNAGPTTSATSRSSGSC